MQSTEKAKKKKRIFSRSYTDPHCDMYPGERRHGIPDIADLFSTPKEIPWKWLGESKRTSSKDLFPRLRDTWMRTMFGWTEQKLLEFKRQNRNNTTRTVASFADVFLGCHVTLPPKGEALRDISKKRLRRRPIGLSIWLIRLSQGCRAIMD